VSIGWWPPNIEFDVDDMATVAKVMEDRNKRRT